MFNLLPTSLKAIIKKEYKLRKAVVILAFVVFIEVTIIIFVFPSWLVTYNNENEVKDEYESLKSEIIDVNVSPAIESIKAINSKLNILNSNLEYPKVIPYVDLLLSKKPKSISLNQFTYSGTGANTAEINIGGVSATREALVAFVKALEEAKSFKEVNLPISNLAKEKNIIFTMTLKISKE